MTGRSRGEERVELGVGQPVRVLAVRLEAHQVHHVHHAHPQVGQVLAQQAHGGERLERGHVAGAGHHHVGLRVPSSLLAQSQMPMPRVQCAAGLVHRQPVQRGLLAGHDHVDVVRLRRQWSATDSRQLASGGR